MATEYLDRDDKVLTRDQWVELRHDKRYCSVKRYDNGEVRVEVEWYGKIDSAQNYMDRFKKVFKVMVHNYTSDGTLALDGANGETWWRDETEALQHYESFLKTWTESHDNGGKFVEEGNTLKPINPDAPESAVVVQGFEGDCAW